MLYVLFVILLIWFGWKVLVLAVKATWGIMKIAFYLILFPIVLIGLVMAGLIYLALPILVIAGIIALICGI
jgi:TRAP-type C4-dicarboxylate transport system permease small subunit